MNSDRPLGMDRFRRAARRVAKSARWRSTRRLSGLVLVVGLVGAITPLATIASAYAGPHSNATSCNFSTGSLLNVRAAAAVTTASGGTLGVVQAQQLATSFLKSSDVCKSKPSPSVAVKLSSIARLYRTNKAQAHRQLLALVSGLPASPHFVLLTAHLVPHGPGPCPSLAATVNISDASTTSDDIAAAATASGGGDNQGASSAMNAAASDFQNWANNSGATTVGDWIAIAAAAQALGNDSFATTAIGNAQQAAAAVIKKATPRDPCGASPAELDCFVQAAAVGQLLDAPNVPDLSKLLDCDALWSFTMGVSGSDAGDTKLVVEWDQGYFLVAKDGTIRNGSGTWKGSVHSATSTTSGSCGSGTSQATLIPSSFHYTITGHRTAQFIQLALASPDFNLNVQSAPNPTVCMKIFLGLIRQIEKIFNAYPAYFPVQPGQTTVNYTASSNGTTTTVTAKQLRG